MTINDGTAYAGAGHTVVPTVPGYLDRVDWPSVLLNIFYATHHGEIKVQRSLGRPSQPTIVKIKR